MTKETKKISTVSILSAMGMVLMLIEIPFFIGGLNFDLSDVVVLVAFMMYGWKEAFIVGLVKAVLHAWLKTAFGPLYIGEITAAIASMVLVLGLWLGANKFKFNRLITSIFAIGLLTVILTFLNYIFITPMWAYYLTNWEAKFVFFTDIQGISVGELFGFNSDMSYLSAVLALFVPFNVIKGTIIFSVYFAIDRSIAAYLKYNQ